MALLKVRDDEIFSQVLKEVEVDYEQQRGDINHAINRSEKDKVVCDRETASQSKLVDNIVNVMNRRKLLRKCIVQMKKKVTEKKNRKVQYENVEKFY